MPERARRATPSAGAGAKGSRVIEGARRVCQRQGARAAAPRASLRRPLCAAEGAEPALAARRCAVRSQGLLGPKGTMGRRKGAACLQPRRTRPPPRACARSGRRRRGVGAAGRVSGVNRCARRPAGLRRPGRRRHGTRMAAGLLPGPGGGGGRGASRALPAGSPQEKVLRTCVLKAGSTKLRPARGRAFPTPIAARPPATTLL